MDALERLVAVQAIRDLVVTYAMAFDDRDWHRLATVWTEDAAWIAPAMPSRAETRSWRSCGRACPTATRAST